MEKNIIKIHYHVIPCQLAIDPALNKIKRAVMIIE